MTEQWKDIPGFPGYRVSDHGRVTGKDGRILKPGILRSGHLQVSLRKDGKTYHRRIHRLVLTTFGGPPESDDLQCCHGDGVPHNNHISNLRWGTAVENAFDRFCHGTTARILSVDDVKEIRGSSESSRTLAKKYGVSHRSINYCRARKTHKEVA